MMGKMRETWNLWGPTLLVVLASILMTVFFLRTAHAQNVQTVECSRGCNFAADPPQDGSVTSCILSGIGQNSIKTPVVNASSITPAPPASAELKPKTCWWPGVVVAPGTYTATAVTQSADGRNSVASPPLSLTVSPPPVGGATNLRVVP